MSNQKKIHHGGYGGKRIRNEISAKLRVFFLFCIFRGELWAKARWDPVELTLLMGGPSPPGGGVAGVEPPRRGGAGSP
jgi:hypothetical protein